MVQMLFYFRSNLRVELLPVLVSYRPTLQEVRGAVVVLAMARLLLAKAVLMLKIIALTC